MTKLKVKINAAEVRRLLKSPEVKADLEERAERIARSAGPGFRASSMVGKNRARASVITDTRAARRREAKDGVLSKAIGAGR